MKRHKYIEHVLLEVHDVLCNWCGNDCVDSFCELDTFDWNMGPCLAHLCGPCFKNLVSLFCIAPSLDGDEHIINDDFKSVHPLPVPPQPPPLPTLHSNIAGANIGQVWTYPMSTSSISVVYSTGESEYDLGDSPNEGSD